MTALDKRSSRDVVNITQTLAQEQGGTVSCITPDNCILAIAECVIHLEDGRLSTQPMTVCL